MDRTEVSERTLKLLYENPDLRIAIDTETDGLRPDDGRSKGIGLSIAFRVPATGRKVKLYWGVNHQRGENVDEATMKKIIYVIVKQRRPLIFANVQFDIFALLTMGIDVRKNPFWDVLTMMNMANEEWTQGRRGLDELAVYFGVGQKIHEWGYVRTETVKGRERPIEKTTLKWQKENGWPHTTPEMLYDYAAQDALVTLDVCEKIEAMPEWQEIPPELWEFKQEFIRDVLVEMKARGIEIDQELTRQLRDEGERAKEKVKEVLGLNPASINDAYTLWIERLGMPVLKRSEKTGRPSFDKTVIAQYEEMLAHTDSEDAKYVRVYQGWKTAVGLLLNPYLDFVSPDGRLRTSYTTHQTVTGRLSSREPNLQQISKDGGAPWNNRIKKCFRAKKGYTLLSVDYSQLELRIGTAYSQEPELLKIFAEGRDIFTEMTVLLKEQFAKAGEKRLAEEWTRQNTKTLVYSIQYGGGVKRIMSAFGMSAKQAKAVIDNFYRTYRRFRGLNELCTKRVEDTLKLKIWSGRYRHFKYKSQSYKGMNSLIQGGAADVVERVMVYAMKNLDNPDCRMLLQVHDALVFEVKDELVDEYSERIKTLMESVNEICDPEGVERGDPLFPVTFAVEVSVW